MHPQQFKQQIRFRLLAKIGTETDADQRFACRLMGRGQHAGD